MTLGRAGDVNPLIFLVPSIRYRDHEGTLKTVPGFTDKTATQQYAAKLERDASMIRAGLLEPAVLYQNISLDEHLAAFETSLKSKDVSPEQVKLVVNRCKALLKVAKITWLSGISAEAVSNALAKLREKKTNGKRGASAQTSNHYLRAMKQFTRWLRLEKRNIDDPLVRLEMLNVQVDRRHDRRALTDVEVSQLLAATLNGKTAYRVEPADRLMLYIMALSTGLRASELASLTTDGLDLDSRPPTVTVKAGYSKRRRLDILPLPTDILEQARSWLKEKPKSVKLWPGDWAANKYAGKMLQIDLADAGVPYVDANGLFADFHALRHTYITNLARNGVSLVTAQKLARHSTPMLTAQRYTHIDLQDQKVAVDRLPSLQRPLQRAGDFSGREVATDGTEACADPNEENPEIPSKMQENQGFMSGEREIRTPGTLRYAGFQDRCNRPLCHLSGADAIAIPESCQRRLNRNRHKDGRLVRIEKKSGRSTLWNWCRGRECERRLPSKCVAQTFHNSVQMGFRQFGVDRK